MASDQTWSSLARHKSPQSQWMYEITTEHILVPSDG